MKDPVVKELPVYLSHALCESLCILQYPLRPRSAPRFPVTSVRMRPKHFRLEMDYAIPTHMLGTQQEEEEQGDWEGGGAAGKMEEEEAVGGEAEAYSLRSGEATDESVWNVHSTYAKDVLMKNKSGDTLMHRTLRSEPVGSSSGYLAARVAEAEAAEAMAKATASKDPASVAAARVASQARDEAEFEATKQGGKTSCVGVLHNGALYLTPVYTKLQMRPTMDHVDRAGDESGSATTGEQGDVVGSFLTGPIDENGHAGGSMPSTTPAADAPEVEQVSLRKRQTERSIVAEQATYAYQRSAEEADRMVSLRFQEVEPTADGLPCPEFITNESAALSVETPSDYLDAIRRTYKSLIAFADAADAAGPEGTNIAGPAGGL